MFFAVGLIGILLIATPAFASLIQLPGEEPFSQLYLFGPEHMADNYPFNIVVGQTYTVYVGVGNHMGSPVNYMVYLKFRNQTDSSPDRTAGTPSSLDPLYEYKFIVADGDFWESPLTFSITDASTSGNNSLVKTLVLNGDSFNVYKPSVWNANATVFYYQLVFELWTYNAQLGQFSYNNRAVDLQLNVTSANR